MTKKRALKAVILILILVKFFHYNSHVIQQYHLFNTVVPVDAEVNWPEQGFAALAINYSGYGTTSIYSVLNLTALTNLKNEDLNIYPTARVIRLTFELRGKEHETDKTVFRGKDYAYQDNNFVNEMVEKGSHRFFVNPQNPEKDIFIYKPRPSKDETVRFFLSVIVVLCALLCFTNKKPLRNVGYVGSSFCLGTLMALQPHGMEYILCLLILGLYILIAFGIYKLWHKKKKVD